MVEVAQHCVSDHLLQIRPIDAHFEDTAANRPRIVTVLVAFGNLKNDLVYLSDSAVLRVSRKVCFLSCSSISSYHGS